MHLLSLILALALSLAPSNAKKGSSIEYATVEEALAALRANSNAKIRVEQGWTIVEVQEGESESSLWSFTPTEHPAHPAAVKRTIYERDGVVRMRMDAICGATKAACDKLIEEFKELNRQIRDHMKGDL